MTTRLEHLRDIRYFHFARGDLSRYCDWPAAKVHLTDHAIQALADVESAQRALDAAQATFSRMLDKEIHDEEDQNPET